YKMLDEGILPVVKGHLLNEEDQVLRRYILDMMCKGKVVLKAGFPLNDLIVRRMQPLIADGLVDCDEGVMLATSIMKSFFHNICMAFDQRLQLSKESETLFSQAI